MMARRRHRKHETGQKAEAGQRNDPPPPPTRRDFLWKLWLGIGGVALLEAIWLAIDFLRPQGSGLVEGARTVVVAGPLERFEPNSVTAYPRGKFYLARLDVVTPPAPRALDAFPVRIENGIVKVDISRPQRRKSFQPDQVTRA